MPKRRNGTPLGLTAKRSRTGHGRERKIRGLEDENEASESSGLQTCKTPSLSAEQECPEDSPEATTPADKEPAHAEGIVVSDRPPVEEKKEEAVIVLPECPVCFTPVGENGRAVAPCGHIFCVKCFVRWMRMRSTCPFCRSSVVDEDPVEANPAVFILMVNNEQERLAQHQEENEQGRFAFPLNFDNEGFKWTLDLVMILALVGIMWATYGLLLPRVSVVAMSTIRCLCNFIAAIMVITIFHKRILQEEEQQPPRQIIGNQMFRIPRNIHQ
uniref:RING-type domain-containing protein n=1 Tax=Lotharella globosa TaxID=91324 RepID=A0A6V3RJT6_9EUKA